MDAFPDALLLMVLSHVDDGLTLLDVVPLVCKRWHRLSRDPAAWRSATVDIKDCSYSEEFIAKHKNHDAILNAARVLVHAPALRRVCFGWYSPSPGPFSCSYDEEMMTSALVRSRAEVREIVFPQPCSWAECGMAMWIFGDPLEKMQPQELALLVDFLSRNSGHVRYLKMGHMLLAGKQLLRALSRCENLEALHLVLPERFQYQGELRGRRMPKLKRLTLKSFCNVDHCRAFLRDLVSCVAQSVRHVRCEDGCESSAVVLAELSRCVELRSLHCGVEGVVAFAKTLTGLRNLSLVLPVALAVPFNGDKDQHRVLSTAERALRACAELQDLRELRLDDGNRMHLTVWDREDSQALPMLKLLTTLGTKAPNLTHISTNGMLSRHVSPETLLGFFKSLPRLESLHIDRFQCDHLPGLAEVGGMKQLSGKVAYRLQEPGSSRSSRAAIEQFKLQRPEVDCRLSDHIFFFYW